MRTTVQIVVGLALTLSISGIAGCAPGNTASSGGAPSSSQGQNAEGQQLVEAKCTRCHTMARVNEASKSQNEWRATVERMVLNGLDVTADEKTAIVDYLTARDAGR